MDDVEVVQGRATKKDGVSVDGAEALIPKEMTYRCSKCYRYDSVSYAKKFGLILNDNYICPEDKGYYGTCFICRKAFESTEDLSSKHPTELECKSCLDYDI